MDNLLICTNLKNSTHGKIILNIYKKFKIISLISTSLLFSLYVLSNIAYAGILWNGGGGVAPPADLDNGEHLSYHLYDSYPNHADHPGVLTSLYIDSINGNSEVDAFNPGNGMSLDDLGRIESSDKGFFHWIGAGPPGRYVIDFGISEICGKCTIAITNPPVQLVIYVNSNPLADHLASERSGWAERWCY